MSDTRGTIEFIDKGEEDPALRKHPHPALFGLLLLPFGIVVGYATFAMPQAFKHAGVSDASFALIQAVGQQPHGLKFFWSPALDAGWPRKNWYLLSALLGGVALSALLFVSPVATPTLYTAVLIAAAVGAATSATAVSALMAVTMPKEKYGAVSGWSNAGNLGGTGLGGALGGFLANHTSTSVAALVLGGASIVTALPVLLIKEPKKTLAEHQEGESGWERFLRGTKGLLKQLFDLTKSRMGWSGLLICLSPVGAGAATGFFTNVNLEYHVGDDAALFVCGVFGCFVSAAGSLVGGVLADKMNRRLLYAFGGLLTAACAIYMAFGSTTAESQIPWFGGPVHFGTTFVYGTIAYQFTTGICYAAFTAFVLEIIGDTPGAATKYSLFAALSNQAIGYVTGFDIAAGGGGAKFLQWADHRGRMMIADALQTFVGLVVLALVLSTLARQEAPQDLIIDPPFDPPLDPPSPTS